MWLDNISSIGGYSLYFDFDKEHDVNNLHNAEYSGFGLWERDLNTDFLLLSTSFRQRTNRMLMVSITFWRYKCPSVVSNIDQIHISIVCSCLWLDDTEYNLI